MAQSTKTRGKVKPEKPYPDFPLFAHATGRWAKKIRGKLHYFGAWNDPDAALNKYLAERDYLQSGRTPPANLDGLTIRDLCNRYLTNKQHLLDNSELSPRTFQGYYATCEKIIGTFGKTRLVDDIAAEDFEQLRRSLAETRGPVALGNEIQRVRGVFKYAYDEGLVERPIRFGQSFRKPSRKTLRLERASKTAKHGKRMFEADELRTIIENAGQPLKAMILLGINCGFGATDISNLPQSVVDLDNGWIDYPRPKTGVDRRCPLWSETVDAVRESITTRPRPQDDSHEQLVFITKYGQPWVKTNAKGTPADALGQEFSKLLTKLKLKRPGVSFYALRHTFETIGGDSRDQVAVDHIMGHVRDDMASLYRERISDERLQAVTDGVHTWLFGAAT